MSLLKKGLLRFSFHFCFSFKFCKFINIAWTLYCQMENSFFLFSRLDHFVTELLPIGCFKFDVYFCFPIFDVESLMSLMSSLKPISWSVFFVFFNILPDLGFNNQLFFLLWVNYIDTWHDRWSKVILLHMTAHDSVSLRLTEETFLSFCLLLSLISCPYMKEFAPSFY